MSVGQCQKADVIYQRHRCTEYTQYNTVRGCHNTQQEKKMKQKKNKDRAVCRWCRGDKKRT